MNIIMGTVVLDAVATPEGRVQAGDGVGVAHVLKMLRRAAEREQAPGDRRRPEFLAFQQLQPLGCLSLSDPSKGHQSRQVLPARLGTSTLPVVDRRAADADEARVVLLGQSRPPPLSLQ